MTSSDKSTSEEDDLVYISQFFHPKKSDGYALIENVETKKGKRILDKMVCLFAIHQIRNILLIFLFSLGDTFPRRRCDGKSFHSPSMR